MKRGNVHQGSVIATVSVVKADLATGGVLLSVLLRMRHIWIFLLLTWLPSCVLVSLQLFIFICGVTSGPYLICIVEVTGYETVAEGHTAFCWLGRSWSLEVSNGIIILFGFFVDCVYLHISGKLFIDVHPSTFMHVLAICIYSFRLLLNLGTLSPCFYFHSTYYHYFSFAYVTQEAVFGVSNSMDFTGTMIWVSSA